MDSSGPTPESAIRSPTAGGHSSASSPFPGWSRPILRDDPSSPSGLNRAAVNGADALARACPFRTRRPEGGRFSAA